MITEEEKEEIIQKATERTLLLIPEVVGNLMTNQAALMKMNREFYDKYPEFKDKKQIVASVMEEVDGDNTFADYDKKLEIAIPKIRERILTVKGLNTTTVGKPKLDYSNGEI